LSIVYRTRCLTHELSPSFNNKHFTCKKNSSAVPVCYLGVARLSGISEAFSRLCVLIVSVGCYVFRQTLVNL
jgi:hypothetical protein